MRFTIRDLLWLMIVAAVALGWWRSASEIAPLKKTIQSERQIYYEIERELNEQGRFTNLEADGSIKLRSVDDDVMWKRVEPFPYRRK